MKHKREKLIRIMNELVIFCENLNMCDLNINFKLQKRHGDHGHQELEMIGVLVDGGSISYLDQILTICIFRKD